MKLFACQSCQQLLFFESVKCTRCGRALAYLQDREIVSAIEPLEEEGEASKRDGPPARRPPAPAPAAAPTGTPPSAPGTAPVEVPPPPPPPPQLWRSLDKAPKGATTYKLCLNYTEHAVCNWALPADDEDEYCLSCRLNHVIPNLSIEGAKAAWHRLEIAKRRVVYTLRQLGLPLKPKTKDSSNDDQSGLAFDLLRDEDGEDGPKVFTGHEGGLITINIAEADDPFREKMRLQMGESYRTVLGHFRHELGHYYWDVLIKGGPILQPFRDLFGDEQADYEEAQKRHYGAGPPADWPVRFVSAYASMHPWEDWAETWAHYLHIFDTLETARAYGLSLAPTPVAKHKPESKVAARRLDPHSFDDLVAGWLPLTMALNGLNRSMGLSDGYPFVLSDMAITKLRFVHDVVSEYAG